MQAGGKIRYHSWWHGKYLHIPGNSKIVTETGEPADDMFYVQGSSWEEYKEYKRIENWAIWLNARNTLFRAPINENGEIDHQQWAEVTNPTLAKTIIDQVGPSL
jgi:hypothetical protein